MLYSAVYIKECRIWHLHVHALIQSDSGERVLLNGPAETASSAGILRLLLIASQMSSVVVLALCL